jgi:hypothetical protein
MKLHESEINNPKLLSTLGLFQFRYIIIHKEADPFREAIGPTEEYEIFLTNLPLHPHHVR